MGKNSGIAWTDHTFNPWIGCQRVSPGCENCYAESYDQRWNGGIHWGVKGERRVTSPSNWRQPIKWNLEAAESGTRARVFCASLADVFEDRPELAAPRNRLWKLIAETPALDWLLLTKRPANADRFARVAYYGVEMPSDRVPHHWPRNVWLGVTAEDQQRADERIPVLLGIPAAIRFVSYEPALGPVDFTRVGWPTYDALRAVDRLSGRQETARLDWIIVGGESGPGARPFDLAWARSTIAQCRAAGVACFVKQLGADPVSARSHDDPRGRLGRSSHGGGLFDIHLASTKGDDPSEWPADLRVQEHPR